MADDIGKVIGAINGLMSDPLSGSKNKKVMKMNMELLNIAEQDLKAAKVLHENELYPQSIFYFQQSVEKANKSFALITYQVEEKDLLKEVGHETINIYQKSLQHQRKRYEQLKEKFNKIPELKKSKFFKDFDANRNLRQLDIILSEIYTIKKDKKELIYISQWEIRRILKEIESANKELEKAKKKISDFKITDRVWNKMKTEMLELYNSLSKYNPLQIEEAKNNFHSNDMKLLVERNIKSLIEPMNIIQLSISLYYLAVITLPHSSLTRYPQNNLTPVGIYTKKLPIVKMLPELIDIQVIVLKELKIQNNKFEEINEIH
ncbi:MAG: HEPN domain-containing protein [Euryarchaeota archaeon]|nr:HEPN domain-containing protein [Euryarchaeota archaeon]